MKREKIFASLLLLLKEGVRNRRIMIGLCLSLFLSVSLTTYSQITVNLKNVTLRQSLKKIERVSSYKFFYNENLPELEWKVSLKVKNASIDYTMDGLLKNMELSYKKEQGNLIVLIRKGQPEQTPGPSKRITGKVVDEKGDPIIGASVIEKDSPTNGVITDLDGKFSLTTKKSGVIQITYIGYQPQIIKAAPNKLFVVKMVENALNLNEVVVIGYGTQKKLDVTGAISQVDNKELKQAPSGNLSSMLAGRLPGLITTQRSGQPGLDGSSLFVRGVGAGDGSPLIVVDGVITDYFPDFSPDEVESVTILKDATSAAVYGVRAAAGVILVTTKRGAVQKPTVTFNSAITLSQNTDFPKFLNGPDYANWYNKAQSMDGVSDENLRFTKEEIERITHPDENEHIYGNTDWFDLLFRSAAPAYTNTASISGGVDKVKFFASVGAYNQRGIIKRTSFDKYNFRVNVDAKVTDNFDLSFDLSGHNSKQKEPGASAGVGSYASIFQQALLSYPYLKPYSVNGLPMGSINQDGNGNNNPIAARDYSGTDEAKSHFFQGNIAMKYRLPFVKGLSLKFNASYVKNYTLKKAYLLPYKLYCWNQSTRQGGEQLGRIANKASLDQWFTNSEGLTIQPSIEYANSFGKHNVSALFLYEYSKTNQSGMSAGRSDFPITDIMDLNFGLEVIDDLVKGSHSQDKRGGYVVRLNYNYAEKYLLEITSRIDASTALPKKYRWGVFPGVSVGWRISEEDFFKNAVPFVDNLKFRASAGRLGSDRAISNTMTYFSTASLSSDPCVLYGSVGQKYLGLSTPPNPKLKWELTDTYNVGLESSMWNGLLGVELDVFYMKTTRSLESQSANFPPSLGFYFPTYINYGSHDNRGFELVLSHRNKIGDLSYNVRGNVSWARNKILKLTEDPYVPNYKRYKGRPMGEYLGFKADGLFQTEDEIAHSALFGPTLPGDVKLKDINGDGKITWDQDLLPVGRNSVPEIMFGLNLGAEWKGLDFSMLLQGAAKCDVNLCGIYGSGIRDDTFYTRPFYADGNTPYYLVEGAWTPDHTNAKYPRLGIGLRNNGGKFSSWWVVDASYVRVKSMQLGYTIPSKWTQKAGLKKVRAYVAGSNLFTLSHLDHLDPEMPSVNQGYYPQQRTYEFGLNITF